MSAAAIPDVVLFGARFYGSRTVASAAVDFDVLCFDLGVQPSDFSAEQRELIMREYQRAREKAQRPLL